MRAYECLANVWCFVHSFHVRCIISIHFFFNFSITKLIKVTHRLRNRFEFWIRNVCWRQGKFFESFDFSSLQHKQKNNQNNTRKKNDQRVITYQIPNIDFVIELLALNEPNTNETRIQFKGKLGNIQMFQMVISTSQRLNGILSGSKIIFSFRILHRVNSIQINEMDIMKSSTNSFRKFPISFFRWHSRKEELIWNIEHTLCIRKKERVKWRERNYTRNVYVCMKVCAITWNFYHRRLLT